MIIGSVVCLWMNGSQHGIHLVGQVPARLPPPSLPDFSFHTIRQLAPKALAGALLGLIEALSIDRSIAAMGGIILLVAYNLIDLHYIAPSFGPAAWEVLKRSGYVKIIGRDHFFATQKETIDHIVARLDTDACRLNAPRPCSAGVPWNSCIKSSRNNVRFHNRAWKWTISSKDVSPTSSIPGSWRHRTWDTSGHNRVFPSGAPPFHRSWDKRSSLPALPRRRHGLDLFRHLGLCPVRDLFQRPGLPVLFRLFSAWSVPPCLFGFMVLRLSWRRFKQFSRQDLNRFSPFEDKIHNIKSLIEHQSDGQW
jgi:hypothetical protein